MSSIDLFLNVLRRNDTEIRRDSRYWPHYYTSASNITAKAFDYIPELIRNKVYLHDSPYHRLTMARKNPVAKYLVFDIPKMMFKEFFHFEDDKKKEVMQEKIYMLKDMRGQLSLTQGSTFEALDGWAYLCYFDSEHPRYDGMNVKGVKRYTYDKASPGSIIKIKSFPRTSVTVLNTDLSGDPNRIKIDVPDANNQPRTFTMEESRFSVIRTRPFDHTYQGMTILESIWDYLVLDGWVTYNMGERAAREGSGYKHVTFPDEDVNDEAGIKNLAALFMGSSSSKGAFTSDKVGIDEKGFGPHSVNWNIIADVLLTRMAIGSGVAKSILEGVAEGRVTGGEVNERGAYAAISERQEDLNYLIKELMRKVFKNLRYKFYNVKHNLVFRMTEKDRADIEKLKAETKQITLAWKSTKEVRELEGLDGDKEDKQPLQQPPQAQLPQKPAQKLLPAPKEEKQDFTDPIVDGSYRYDYFEEVFPTYTNNGKELIAPVVLTKEGVYNYTEHKTKEFVSYEELVKAAKFSPSLPIILDDHHQMVINNQYIQYGVVTNIRGDNKRRAIIGDAHFFVDKTPKEYLALLRNNKKIEGSVGKYIGSFGSSGEFLGEYYDASQEDIKMMHYAVSNKFIGKCSVQMGCGVNQT